MGVLLLALVLLIGAALAFTIVGITAARRLVRGGVGDGHNDVSAAIFGVGGTIYAVFLAFLVITVWSDHENARTNVSEEASLLSTLYRGSAAMEPESGTRLRGLIREYTQAVITEEWPIQARTGGASERARSAGLQMFRLFGAIPPATREADLAIDQMQLRLLAELQADRNKRILQASAEVSPLIWVVALANGLLVIVMSFFLYPDRDWPHVMLSAMLSAMIAMLIYVVFVLQQPFRGLLPLHPDAFTYSFQVYDSVDRMIASPPGATR
jgi:hypothetical protein